MNSKTIMPRAFDIIGDIAIINIPNNLKKKAKIIAKSLLKKHKNIHAVYSRSKIHGRLRVPRLLWLAGKRQSETIHKENGCMMKLDIKTCYFSPRLGTDRLEIAKKVKRGEKILVMFSGIAPYALVIARHSKASKIYCIELSKIASKYAEENVKLNKFKNITIIQGDVKKQVPKLVKKIKFDRIVMARPQLKDTFLKQAFMASKHGTIIHFYDFVAKKSFPQESIEKIQTAARAARKKIKIIAYKKVREIAPYKYHARIDFKII